MAMTINTNIAAINGQRNLQGSASKLNESIAHLSSGLRINSAKDDAAGLAISSRMSSQIKGLAQAGRNANDGISMAQTAEGALQESANILQRIRELSVQSTNDTNTASDRKSMQAEVDELVEELQRMAETTQFNGRNLLDGSIGEASFQIGADAGSNQTISFTMGNSQTDKLSQIGTTVTAGETSSADLTTGTTIAAGDLLINGTAIGALASTATAEDWADAINVAAKSANDGVDNDIADFKNVQTLDFDTVAIEAGGEYTIDLGTGTDATVASDATVVTADVMASAINGVDGFEAEVNDNGKIEITKTDKSAFSFSETISIDGTATGDAAAGFTAIDTSDTEFAGQITLLDNSSDIIIKEVTADVLEDVGLDAAGNDTTTIDKIDISTRDGAATAISSVDAALEQINEMRGAMGAVQSRFESTINNLSTTAENVSAARSRIVDADFATETAEMTKSQILQQAGTAMLAQSNQLGQGVLSLLQ